MRVHKIAGSNFSSFDPLTTHPCATTGRPQNGREAIGLREEPNNPRRRST